MGRRERRMLTVSEIRGVFLHVPKTAGTTITAAFKSCAFVVPHQKLAAHRAHYLRLIGGTLPNWHKLFKFSFVRNPWGRFRAYFLNYREHNSPEIDAATYTHADFQTFVADMTHQDRLAFTTNELITGDLELFDFIGQFEHLTRDVQHVAKCLDIDVPDLPHLNTLKATVSPDWRDYYDEQTYDIVVEYSAWEIERFGYTFDDCATQRAA